MGFWAGFGIGFVAALVAAGIAFVVWMVWVTFSR